MKYLKICIEGFVKSLLLVTNSPDYEIEKESTTSNSKLIATFGEIVKTNRVLEKVKSNLQIDVNVNDIRNGVSATGVQGTDGRPRF